MRSVSLVNQSTVVSDSDLATVAAALERQVWLHFQPMWGIEAQLYYGRAALPGSDVLYICDDTTQADALGFHTSTQGNVVGYVFAKTDEANGVPWSVTASHELLEMLGNPWVNLMCWGMAGGQLVLVPREVGDPVEGATYAVSGVQVSDFVGPRWFEPGAGGGQFDYLGRISAPFLLDQGGYIAYQIPATGEWKEVFGQTVPHGGGPEAPSKYRRRQRMKA
jgi:hypothetical protein